MSSWLFPLFGQVATPGMDRVVLITAKLSPDTQRAQGESSPHAKLPARRVRFSGFPSRLMQRRSWAENHPKSHTLVVRQARHYNVTACVSWNCILVPGLISNVPAVCPYRAC